MELNLIFQRRATGDGESASFATGQQHVDVLTGQELQALSPGEFEPQADHVFRQEGFFNDPGGQHPDLDVANGFNFPDTDDQVFDRFSLAHQCVAFGNVATFQRKWRMKGIMNFTALNHTPATATCAVLAGIGQHHTLPQGSSQD
jgi:hypothetical protein